MFSKRKSKQQNRKSESPLKQKTKFWTKIERKITNVAHEEFLRQSDVTLEEKRTLYIYTTLNLIAFVAQIVIILIGEIYSNFELFVSP